MLADVINQLVRELSKLPSIGEKTALRMAFHIIALPETDVRSLARSIVEVKEKVTLCSTCFNLTDADPCSICRSQRGDADTICVVENPAHLAAFERTARFKGAYQNGESFRN